MLLFYLIALLQIPLHDGYIWKLRSISFKERFHLHLSEKAKDFENNGQGSTNLLDRYKQGIQEAASKLRKEAEIESSKTANVSGTAVHVKEELKDFAIDKPIIRETKDLFPYFTKEESKKACTIDVDFSSDLDGGDLPSFLPIINYLKVIRKYNIEKFDEDGIANDDFELGEDLIYDSFVKEFSASGFLSISSKFNLTLSERNQQLHYRASRNVVSKNCFNHIVC